MFQPSVLVVLTVEILIGRTKKAEPLHKYSHLSDWGFPILLLLTAVTGILAHIFRYMGLPLTTYYTYWIHLAIAVALLVTQVPFGKWTHVVYRPLAIYLNGIQEKTLAYALAKTDARAQPQEYGLAAAERQ